MREMVELVPVFRELLPLIQDGTDSGQKFSVGERVQEDRSSVIVLGSQVQLSEPPPPAPYPTDVRPVPRKTSSQIRPYRAPFAKRAIPFPGPGEIVPTPPENIYIIGYFRKIFVLNDFRPASLAGHKRPLFLDRLYYLRKKEGQETPLAGHYSPVRSDGENPLAGPGLHFQVWIIWYYFPRFRNFFRENVRTEIISFRIFLPVKRPHGTPGAREPG